ncbi:MAG: sodium:solute symporter family protein [Opitutus sp.]|nr:sodium:solute symporter family protein [Opitutus sp.]
MIPVIIIGLYLLLVIALGLISARFFRGGTADYFVASRSLGPFVLFMTVFGTTMTAFALVGSTAETYEFGIGTFAKLASWSALVHPACFFLIGLPLWSLGKRHGYVTQIEYFRDRFDSSALGYVLFPVLAGLMIPYVIVGLLGVGSVVGGVTVGAFPEAFAATRGAIPPWLTMAVILTVVLFYVLIGGARSAAWVNVFQTVVFVGMGLLAFWLIADKLGGLDAASARASPAKAVRTGNMGEGEFFTYWMIPLSVGVFPHVFQNFLTARSAKSYKLLLTMQPISILLAWLPCILIGFWATGATLPGSSTPLIPAGINANAVLGLMVGKLTSPIVSGLVAAGVLAAISLDAQFIALGTMFTRDIVVHFFGPERFSDQTTVWIARGFIVVVVILTYAMTFAPPRQIFALGTWCFSGYAGLIPLLLAALYWQRVTKTAAVVSVMVTAGTWLGLFVASNYGADRKFLVGGMLPVATVLAACALSVVVVSLLTKPPPDKTLAKFFPVESK